MSYLRVGWKHKYVCGNSKDYVFHHSGGYIEDYGYLSNEGLAEIMCRVIDRHFDDKIEKQYFMEKLCQRLNVKLRKRHLSDNEILNDMIKRCEGEEKMKALGKKRPTDCGTCMLCGKCKLHFYHPEQALLEVVDRLESNAKEWENEIKKHIGKGETLEVIPWSVWFDSLYGIAKKLQISAGEEK